MKGPEETAEVGAGNAKKSLQRSCRPAAGEGGKDQGGGWFGWVRGFGDRREGFIHRSLKQRMKLRVRKDSV